MHAIVHTRRSIVGACLGVLLAILFATSATAQNTQVAQVKTVSGQVTIQRGGATVPVKVGDPLYEKDTIDTGADGAIGVTFTDNTVMATGPNSEVALEDYKFDSNNFKGSMTADLRKGGVGRYRQELAGCDEGQDAICDPRRARHPLRRASAGLIFCGAALYSC